MSQQDIIKYLRKFGFGDTEEIAKWLGISKTSVRVATAKLIKNGDIGFNEEKFDNHRKFIYCDFTFQGLKK